jgi:hypothetical protein
VIKCCGWPCIERCSGWSLAIRDNVAVRNRLFRIPPGVMVEGQEASGFQQRDAAVD